MPPRHGLAVLTPLVEARRQEVPLEHCVWIDSAKIEARVVLHVRVVLIRFSKLVLAFVASFEDVIHAFEIYFGAIALGQEDFGAHALTCVARCVVATVVLVAIVHERFVFPVRW